MKIYNWIDSLFDTYAKRAAWLVIFVLGFWLWQNIWQTVFFFDAFQVNSYESLFDFYSNLSGYTNSLLVSTVLTMISTNSITISTFFVSLIKHISLIDIIMMALTLLLCVKSNNKMKWIILPILYLGMFLFIGIMLIIGFQVSSIQELIHILHILSIGSMGIEIVILCFLLYKLVGYVFTLSEINCY